MREVCPLLLLPNNIEVSVTCHVRIIWFCSYIQSEKAMIGVTTSNLLEFLIDKKTFTNSALVHLLAGNNCLFIRKQFSAYRIQSTFHPVISHHQGHFFSHRGREFNLDWNVIRGVITIGLHCFFRLYDLKFPPKTGLEMSPGAPLRAMHVINLVIQCNPDTVIRIKIFEFDPLAVSTGSFVIDPIVPWNSFFPK